MNQSTLCCCVVTGGNEQHDIADVLQHLRSVNWASRCVLDASVKLAHSFDVQFYSVSMHSTAVCMTGKLQASLRTTAHYYLTTADVSPDACVYVLYTADSQYGAGVWVQQVH
jgi:hypothetical protein